MKVVADTMIWVSYCTRKDGVRHRVIEEARRRRVRFRVSEYILNELAKTLTEDLGFSRRFAFLAQRAVLRIARLVPLPTPSRRLVPGDPNDDPIVETAIAAGAHFLVTADNEILKVKKAESVSIITMRQFGMLLKSEL